MKTIKSNASVLAPVILALAMAACGKDLNTKTITIGQTSAKRDSRPLREPTPEALFAAKYSAVNVECGYYLKRSNDTSVTPDYTNEFPAFPETKEEKVTKVVGKNSDYDGQVNLVTEISVDQEADAKSVKYHPTLTLSGTSYMVKKDANATTFPIRADLNSVVVDLDDSPEKDVVIGAMSLENHVNNTTDSFKVVCHVNLTPLATTVK